MRGKGGLRGICPELRGLGVNRSLASILLIIYSTSSSILLLYLHLNNVDVITRELPFIEWHF